ncbi:MAG: hypothetical protein ING72_07330 [Methylobacterium sp.]|jgi:hypothetical protein|nr:hypothetical protein [Methylobacterium sp.]MCA3602886.1 hypothetical protein [Methylobacterium sp.]MCA3614750.1 hypothetical protein [Methylobacterium sp.]MCA4910139.1 hypothetical protein [Methylobacterium sp.]
MSPAKAVMGTGSREENAIKQKIEHPISFGRIEKMLQAMFLQEREGRSASPRRPFFVSSVC